MMKDDLVGDVANGSSRIITVDQDAPALAAAHLMARNGIGSLVVTGRGGTLVGIISERDIITHVIDPGADLSQKQVSDIMARNVVSCTLDTPFSEVQMVMTERRIRHVPIVAGGVAIGMISSREVMGHQHAKDQAMKAAAEQVARLSTSLKALDLDEVTEMIAREVPKLFQAGRSVLCFDQEDNAGKAELRSSRSNCPCPDTDLRARDEAWVAHEQSRPIFSSLPEPCAKLGAEGTSVVIPLTVSDHSGDNTPDDEHTPGHLCMCDFEPDEQTTRELATYKISLLQNILSANLASAKLYRQYQKARETALTDPLTDVGTRRLFEDKLKEECARARRYKRPLCVAIWDIDRFKIINDTLGHTGGDQALLEFSKCLSREKRTTDILARYGGDEFVLLMPETEMDGAIVMLERVRARVAGIRLPRDLSMTVSCGVVGQDAGFDVSSKEIIRRADIALYQAKDAGRNSIARWSQDLKYGTHVETEEVAALKSRVSALMAQSENIFLQGIWGLVQALDARDTYTKNHSENVMRYAVGIAETMGMNRADVEVIRRAAMIHDIGKMGLPDAILRKLGKLNSEEQRALQQHPLIAVRILKQMRSLEREIPIVRHHHERWDGRGYPDRIGAGDIEPGARILAVADAFDAITCTRLYHQGRGLGQAMKILDENAGAQFDPEVVDAMKCWVREISSRLGDDVDVTPQELLDSQKISLSAA